MGQEEGVGGVRNKSPLEGGVGNQGDAGVWAPGCGDSTNSPCGEPVPVMLSQEGPSVGSVM